jgi:hypothetical protein
MTTVDLPVSSKPLEGAEVANMTVYLMNMGRLVKADQRQSGRLV